MADGRGRPVDPRLAVLPDLNIVRVSVWLLFAVTYKSLILLVVEAPSEGGGRGAAAADDDVVVGGANMGSDVTKEEEDEEAVERGTGFIGVLVCLKATLSDNRLVISWDCVCECMCVCV